MVCWSLGPFKRTYKLYNQDPSLPIPRTTRFNQKRLKTSLAEHELTTTTFAASVESNAPCVNREPECSHIDLTESPEGNTCIQSETLRESPFLDSSEDSDLDDDHQSFEDCVSSSEVESDSDIDGDDNDTSDEDKSSHHDSSLASSFSDQEKACMAILSYVSRHCITSEAAKDMIDLIKTACPENETFRTLTYFKVQEVCGKCELHVYDICEKCLALFPLDDSNKYNCSTANCNGWVLKIRCLAFINIIFVFTCSSFHVWLTTDLVLPGMYWLCLGIFFLFIGWDRTTPANNCLSSFSFPDASLLLVSTKNHALDSRIPRH